MKKTKSMRLAVLAAGLLCCSIFTVPAYAQSSEPQEETPPAETEAQPETQNPFSADGTGTVVDNATDEDGKEIAVRGFCLGFRFGLCGFLRDLRGFGLRFRLGGWFRRFIFAFFCQREQVGLGHGIEEIHVVRGFLLVNHQIEDILVRRGDGVKLLAFLVSGIVYHSPGAVSAERVLCFRLGFGLRRGLLRRGCFQPSPRRERAFCVWGSKKKKTRTTCISSMP